MVVLFSRRNGDRQAIFLGRERASGVRRHCAGRIVGAIEIEHHGPALHRIGLQESSALVGCGFSCQIVEYEKEAFVRVASQIRKLQLLSVDFEADDATDRCRGHVAQNIGDVHRLLAVRRNATWRLRDRPDRAEKKPARRTSAPQHFHRLSDEFRPAAAPDHVPLQTTKFRHGAFAGGVRLQDSAGQPPCHQFLHERPVEISPYLIILQGKRAGVGRAFRKLDGV